MRIIVQRDDGTEVDVTEGVQVVYDALYHSMDMSSGFLDTHELAAMWRLARAAGFEEPSRADFACATCGHRLDWHAGGPCTRSLTLNQPGWVVNTCPCQGFTLPGGVEP